MGSMYCPVCLQIMSEGAKECPSCSFPFNSDGFNPQIVTPSEASGVSSVNAERRTDRSGFIYVLSNPSFGGNLYKIGKTTRTPEERAVELSSPTGIPKPYRVEYQQYVSDCHEAERMIHGALHKYRGRREFFEIELDRLISICGAICGTFNVTDTVESGEGHSDISTKAGHEKEPTEAESSVIEPAADPAQDNAFKSVLGVRAICRMCGASYSVTLTRYEEHSSCPNCLSHHGVDIKW